MRRSATQGGPGHSWGRRIPLFFFAIATGITLLLACSSGEQTHTDGGKAPTTGPNTSKSPSPTPIRPDVTPPSPPTTPTVQMVNVKAIAAAVRQHRGRVVVLDFWATWCGPCIERLPHLGLWLDKYGREHVAVVTVSLDEEEDLQPKVLPVLNANGAKDIDYLLHTGDSHDDMVNGIDPDWTGEVPALFLYDRTGRLRYSLSGERELDEIDDLIGKLVRENSR